MLNLIETNVAVSNLMLLYSNFIYAILLVHGDTTWSTTRGLEHEEVNFAYRPTLVLAVYTMKGY